MICDIGLIDYEQAYRIQKEFVQLRRLGEIENSLILAEHKAVFTIGRAGRRENLLIDENTIAQKDIKFLTVDRGGDITFHGPGQLVAYPIIDLRVRGMDLHRYLRDLEELAVRVLSEYGICGERVRGMTGVWIGQKKVVSIGVAAANWVTFHGLSLNVSCDLSFFSMIHPCGIKGMECTSLKDILGAHIPIRDVKDRVSAQFKKMFECGKYAHAAGS